MLQNRDLMFSELETIYAKMPKTLGCVSCGKCCKVQHPHCYCCEFYYIFSAIEKWTEKEKIDLHINCVANYLSNSLQKRCVFLDVNNHCTVYEYRNYNCRAFGMIPKKAYAKRVKDVKKNFPGVRLCLEKQSDCCGGVKPETFIGARKLDEIFDEIRNLDRGLGITEDDINASNNYMTFHDHFLLYTYRDSQWMLEKLTDIKTKASDKEKNEFIMAIRKNMEDVNSGTG